MPLGIDGVPKIRKINKSNDIFFQKSGFRRSSLEIQIFWWVLLFPRFSVWLIYFVLSSFLGCWWKNLLSPSNVRIKTTSFLHVRIFLSIIQYLFGDNSETKNMKKKEKKSSDNDLFSLYPHRKIILAKSTLLLNAEAWFGGESYKLIDKTNKKFCISTQTSIKKLFATAAFTIIKIDNFKRR